MGLFDHIECLYPLPLSEADLVRVQGMEFQTKDTPSQFMDMYRIAADGTLWYEEHDIEDRSDPTAEGVGRIIGMMTKVNKRWVQVTDYTGEIYFYGGDCAGKPGEISWVEFSCYFINGQLRSAITLVKLEES